MNCLFCKIIKGEVSSKIVYQDDAVIVFMDAYPESDGHMLIVPKRHILDLNDMDNETWSHILNIAKDMRKLIEERLNPDGLTLIQNNGDVQAIKHFHLHLKPYYKEKKATPIDEVYKKLMGD